MSDLMTAKEFRVSEDNHAFDVALIQVEELLIDLTRGLREQCKKYAKSGALAPCCSTYRDKPTSLAKVMLTAAIARHAHAFTPYTKEMQNDVSNLQVI